MSFADKLRETTQKSIVLNGKLITGEAALRNVETAESAAEAFRKYAQEQASYGKTKCKAYIGNGGIDYATGGGISSLNSSFIFTFASACSVSSYVKEILQKDGYSSLSVRPKSMRNVILDRSEWYIRIVASW